MFILRGFLAVSFSLAFAASAFAAPGIEGVIAQIRHDPANGNAGWITLHRGSQRGLGQPMTVAVTAQTRFQRVGQRGGSLTTFRALHRGERVRVLLGPGVKGAARVVEILPSIVNRSRNYYVRSYHRRVYHHGRRAVYRRPVPVQRRIVVRTVRRNIRHAVPHHRPVRYFHRPAHHRR